MIQNNSNGDKTRDTTIDEIHQTRERMAERFDRDVAAILKDAEKRQLASGRDVWPGAVTGKSLHPEASPLVLGDGNATSGLNASHQTGAPS